jgi:eukaryotic-like serine/threonine-protein kinase
MLRRGQNDQAKSLYQQALTLEQTAATAANSTDDDRWLMARTMRSQAGLLRLMGDFTGSHAVYGQAIAMLEKTAPASAPSDVRNELALARNALGQLLLDMDDQKQAESEFRGALAVLEPLVTEFPTAPRFRESLATASNSIGLIEERDGRVADCEVQYRRELAEEERLAQDFPDRPEYKRELARASMNLGNLLEAEGRMAEAQALLRRSISLNTELISKQPDDVQVRLDLSKGHTNLGESYRDSGHPERSIAEYEKSRDLASVLIEQFPDSPRYREQLAGNLQNLALAYDAKGDATAEPTYAESLKMYEALVRKFPDNAQYKEGLARSLRNFGAYEAATNRLDRAESCYIRGLSVLKNLHTTESQRIQVGNYVNLGNLRNDAHRPGAEEPLRQAVAISEVLVARKPATREDRVSLAIAQNDLGETMRNSDRTEEAGRLYESAIAGFNTLASENPKAIDIQDYLGYTYESQAELLEKIGQPNKARQSIEAAVQHQQNAIKLSDGKVVGYRVALAGHLGILTKLCIELHAYDDALRAAVEMSKVPPPSSHAYLDPAKLLAHGMTAATQDAHLTSAQREQVIQQYSGEIAMLLRQAMDASPKSRERIKSDPDLSPMLARPEFQSLLGTFATPAAAKAH